MAKRRTPRSGRLASQRVRISRKVAFVAVTCCVLAATSGCRGSDSDDEPVGDAVLAQLDSPGPGWDEQTGDDVVSPAGDSRPGRAYSAPAEADSGGRVCREAVVWLAHTATTFSDEEEPDLDAPEQTIVSSCQRAVERLQAQEPTIVSSVGGDAEDVHYLAFLTVESHGAVPATVRVAATADPG